MKFGYDAETDTLRVVLSSAPIAKGDEDRQGVILDYDVDGNIGGIEMLWASKRTESPSRSELLPA